ncbi:MAG: HAD family phosphatase [Anaerolineales bacterium]|nr:MAG: HAD family phosphatase [Anaerolineales bacterium]
MGIKSIIFDLGGVIVRTENPEPRLRLAEELGLTNESLSQLIFNSESAKNATLGKLTTEDHWQAVRSALALDPDQYQHVENEFWGGDIVDMELVNYLRSLRGQYKTGLLSNAWDDLRAMLFNEWKIADAFDDVVISAEVGLAKPDPNIYLLAAERLGVLPQEAVFVDDFIENVQGARQVGMQAVHFRAPQQALDELKMVLNTNH